MSLSSEDETERRETCTFFYSLYINYKAGEGWIQCGGCEEWTHELCLNANEEDFLCDYWSATDLNKRSSTHFKNEKIKKKTLIFKSLTTEDIVLSSGNFVLQFLSVNYAFQLDLHKEWNIAFPIPFCPTQVC